MASEFIKSRTRINDDGTMIHLCPDGKSPWDPVIKEPDDGWVIDISNDSRVYCKYCHICGAKLQ